MMAHATGNDPAAAQADIPLQAQQQLIINAQYVKDLSFENPHAPASLRQQASPPAVEINVDVKAQTLGPENYEVVLTIKANARVEAEVLFIIELSYAAVATLRNVAPDMISPILLVETPRLIFPFARNIVAETTRDGGFPPLMINPIDFGELLRRNAGAVPNGPSLPGGATA
jgi:preprotein translocase subunit SecB